MALRQQSRHPSGEYSEITYEDMEQSVIARFERIAAAYPDKPAIIDLSRRMTFAEVDRASNRMARALQRRGGRINDPVTILTRNGTDIAASIFGATKAGMCYAALSPEIPVERLQFMMQDLGNPLLITDHHNQKLAQSLAPDGATLVVEDELQGNSDDPIHSDIGPDTLYLIRFTSGSTGRPKGVVSTHRDYQLHLRNLAWSIQLCRHDRRTSLGVSYPSIVSSLLAGTSFYDFDFQHTGMAFIAQQMVKDEITVLGCTVTSFRQLIRSAAGRFTYPQLRVVFLFGEPPTPADILAARGIFSPNCVFSNQYGTTESYIDATFYASVDSAAQLDSLPAGYVSGDMEILLWDEAGKPVTEGTVGEIVVRSRYLTQGYWNRPHLTRERFLPDPDGSDRRIYHTGDLGRKDPDGCLHYMGRKDQQVKIRGHRIEIPEVEAELLALDGVKMAAVAARPGPNGDLRLVAYIVPSKDGLLITSLREALVKRLPAAMVPAAYVFLDALPLTASHKVDRLALPDPGQERPYLAEPYLAPRTPVEETLAQIWAEVLGIEVVGIHDNFLDLGGDSLLASQIVTRVIRSLRIDISLAVIFAAPTVEAMATAVTQAMVATASDDVIERLLADITETAS